MTYEQWLDTYKPVQNRFTDAPFDGNMFETYGQELEFVRQQNPDNVWTLVDGSDDNNIYVVNGLRLVNRLGYFVTEMSLTETDFLEVPVYDEDELEELN